MKTVRHLRFQHFLKTSLPTAVDGWFLYSKELEFKCTVENSARFFQQIVSFLRHAPKCLTWNGFE